VNVSPGDPLVISRILSDRDQIWQPYRYRCVTYLDGFLWTLVYFFGEHKFLSADISDTFCGRVTKFGMVGGWSVDCSTLTPQIQWTLTYFSGEYLDLLFDISHIFCQSAIKFGSVRGIGAYCVAYLDRFSWTLVWGSRDTIWRLASVLHWCPCCILILRWFLLWFCDCVCAFVILTNKYNTVQYSVNEIVGNWLSETWSTKLLCFEQLVTIWVGNFMQVTHHVISRLDDSAWPSLHVLAQMYW